MNAIRNLWRKCFRELNLWKHEKKELGKGAALGILICWLFYDRIWLAAFLWPLLVPWMRHRRAYLAAREKEEIRRDVREMMLFVSNGLSVGYSLEHALKSAYRDMNANR